MAGWIRINDQLWLNLRHVVRVDFEARRSRATLWLATDRHLTLSDRGEVERLRDAIAGPPVGEEVIQAGLAEQDFLLPFVDSFRRIRIAGVDDGTAA
jgi:hypothetical protein